MHHCIAHRNKNCACRNIRSCLLIGINTYCVTHLQVLEDISDRSRDLIFELVRSKADDLLAGMEFVNMEPTSMRRQAHSYADDLINYLRVCFFIYLFFDCSLGRAGTNVCVRL